MERKRYLAQEEAPIDVRGRLWLFSYSNGKELKKIVKANGPALIAFQCPSLQSFYLRLFYKFSYIPLPPQHQQDSTAPNMIVLLPWHHAIGPLRPIGNATTNKVWRLTSKRRQTRILVKKTQSTCMNSPIMYIFLHQLKNMKSYLQILI